MPPAYRCRKAPDPAVPAEPWDEGAEAQGHQSRGPAPSTRSRVDKPPRPRHLPHNLPASPGTVLDDIGQTGCIPVSQCPCVHNGATYAPGATYSTDCTNW